MAFFTGRGLSSGSEMRVCLRITWCWKWCGTLGFSYGCGDVTYSGPYNVYSDLAGQT